MVGSRTVTAIVGLALSLLVSAVAWVYFETALLFLAVPFVPLFLRRRGGQPRQHCPTCGFATRNGEFQYCPRDGTTLREK